MGMVRFAQGLIGKGHQDPDDTGSHDYRFAFAQVELFFQDHHGVSRHKQDQGENPHAAAGQVGNLASTSRGYR